MAVRIVEGQLPYTGGTGIEIDTNKVISLLLREENNLIQVNGDNEIYTDLQLEDGILPTDEFPVGVTVGRVLEADGWLVSGTLLNFKTTSGDYGRWLYGTDGNMYYDHGTGTFTQIYSSTEVNDLFTSLRGELATVAFSGDYNDLSNRPVIPQINDGTLNIKQNNVSKGTFTANQATSVTVDLTDTTYPAMTAGELGTGTDTTNRVVSAKVVADFVNGKISQLMALGKFLSLWDCVTGQPDSFPLSTPYTYTTGDYFLVSTVSSANPAVNYKPTGSSYTTGQTSTTTESEDVQIGDIYIYDGSTWLLQLNHGKSISFSEIAGQPTDNTNLATALNGKQNTLSTQTAYTSKGSATKVPQITTNTLGQVTGITEVTITQPTKTSDLQNDSGFITSSYHDSTKQDTLTAGTNIQISAQNVISATDTTYSAGTGISISSNTISNSGVTSVNNSTGAVTVSEFSPSGTPSVGDVVTKTANGYEWAAPSGGDVMVSSQANNILTSGMKIWAGTQANYESLGTYDNNTVYLTI